MISWRAWGSKPGDQGHIQHLAGETAGREGATGPDLSECGQGENSEGRKDPKYQKAGKAGEDARRGESV